MTEKIQFYPIDITYKVIDERPVIHIYGRTVNNEQVCIIDENFQPYFYATAEKEKKLKTLKIKKEKETFEVTKTEKVKKKLLGKDTNLIKLFVNLPRDVPVIRDNIKNKVKETYEYDIFFTRRYLIDKKITPLTLVEAKGEFTNQKSKTPVFSCTSIKQFSDKTIEKTKTLAFDIETYNPGNDINSEENPIIMISFYSKNLKKVITWKRFKTKLNYIEFVDSEAKLIERFKEIIDHEKPDIITGYFSDGFDIPYINTRAKKYKIELNLGLDYSEISTKKNSSQITGICHLDIFKFIRLVFGRTLKTDSYKLDNVAEELLGEKKHEIELDNLFEIWDNHPKKLEPFCEYNLQDSVLTYKLCEKIMPNITELVKIVGLTIHSVSRMSFSQLVEWFLLKQSPNFHEIAPNRPSYNEIKQRRMNSYKGAFVYEPKPGLYNDIVIFDFRSLYPTIISSHNISPSTFNCKCCKDREKVPIEGKKYWFCRKDKGFIPTIIKELITRRMRIKELLKKEKDNFLIARSESLKLLANSFYGYLGFFGARWYSLESARSVTAYGRYYIQKVIESAKKQGFNVIYSDTDSIFLTLNNKTKKDAARFVDKINLDLPGLMELEYEGFYPAGIFVSAKASAYGAKKKYAILSENNTINIKGFETVRRNWSIVAKDIQKKVLEIILKEKDNEKAIKYVQRTIKDIKNNHIDVKDLIIKTQLTKDIESYESIGPHVAVAKKMKNKGINVRAGSIIRYVVTKGSGRIRDRAKIPEDIKKKDYDANYYITHQIIPSVERIFEVLGYKKEDLIDDKTQSKLGKFF